jgi:hypothetical protein
MNAKLISGKFLKYALVTGLAAALPVLVTAVSNAEALTAVDWLGTLDKAGAVFLSAAIGGVLGTVQALARKPKAP